jgi:hypothetical protein
MGRKRKRRSFETPRKRAAPLAITAKPLRGDDGFRCGDQGCEIGHDEIELSAT